MNNDTAAQLLGPRYCWALHTEPVKRLIDYITALEAKLCQCPPASTRINGYGEIVDLPR